MCLPMLKVEWKIRMQLDCWTNCEMVEVLVSIQAALCGCNLFLLTLTRLDDAFEV